MLRNDAEKIIQAALTSVQPDQAVARALLHADFGDGRVVLVSIGKAAWQMANAAYQQLGDRIDRGVVITKYEHSRGSIGEFDIFEAAHPVPDENSFRATAAAIEAVSGLSEKDTVLLLISGGGSALFEKPLIPAEDLERLTQELLKCGAEIVETNTIRKRFSAVKGGRFAAICNPAKVFSIILSDIIGDPMDMIASGPAYPDSSTAEQAQAIADKYQLTLTPEMRSLLAVETPKELNNVQSHITGSVRQLCRAAEDACRALGYEPYTLTASLSCTARDAGVFLANIAQHHQDSSKSLAFIAGGETVVKVTGQGLGGRNQELAFAAAAGLDGLKDTAVFSVGSDGTDGPTDAAGGYVDEKTMAVLKTKEIDPFAVLQNNDAYHGLEACGGLIKTGPTGTNVNDVAVLLIKR